MKLRLHSMRRPQLTDQNQVRHMTAQHGIDARRGPHQQQPRLQPGIGQCTANASHNVDQAHTAMTLLQFQRDTDKALQNKQASAGKCTSGGGQLTFSPEDTYWWWDATRPRAATCRWSSASTRAATLVCRWGVASCTRWQSDTERSAKRELTLTWPYRATQVITLSDKAIGICIRTSTGFD